MKIYKYWKKHTEQPLVEKLGVSVPISCWGGSNTSEAEALISAQEKIQQVVAKLNGKSAHIENYTVEIREEIIHTVDQKNIVTRNRYGALVLNSEDIVIIDVDQPKQSFFDWLNFFSRPDRKEKMLEQAIRVARSYGKFTFRIYATRGGLRVIVTTPSLKTDDPKVVELFEAFNCDPLYASLCKKQECFRARLTPKPNYIRQRVKCFRFPEKTSQDHLEWLEQYEQKSKKFSTCHLLKEVGARTSLHPAIAYHDEICRVQNKLPLG